MALDRLTKVTGAGIASDHNLVGNNAIFTGVTTTGSSFNVGVSTFHSTLAEVHNIKSTGIITATGGSFSGNVTAVDGTFTGNVSIGGTLTYEDVTNIDSVGIITARSGLVSPYADIDDYVDVGSNIKLGNAGVITATSYRGDGSQLTGIVAGLSTISGVVNVANDLDVDGHTNLDNVSVAGVTTFSGDLNIAENIIHTGDTDTKISFPSNDTIRFDVAGSQTNYIQFDNAKTVFMRPIMVGDYVSHSGIREIGVKFFNAGTGNNNTNVGLGAEDNGTSGGMNHKTFQVFRQGSSVNRVDIDNFGNLRAKQGFTVAGISTFTGAIDANGDLDVDGHTNLDNVSVAGVTTFAGNIELTGALNNDLARIKIPDGMNGAPYTGNLEFGNSRDFVVLHDGHHNYIKANNGNVYITCGGNTLATLLTSGTVLLGRDLDVDGHTNLDNVSIAGVTTFSDTIRVGTGVTIETNGQATYSGIVTATSFKLSDGSDVGGGVDSDAQYNTVGGTNAGDSITSDGINNTAFGYNAITAVTEGDNNTAVGFEAGLQANASTFKNTFIGANSGRNVTSGTRNTFIGYDAGRGHSNKSTSVAIGYNAAYSASETDIVCVGSGAGQNISEGSVSIGADSGGNISGIHQVFIGKNCGKDLTGNSSKNTLVGYSQFGSNSGARDNNTGVGYGAAWKCQGDNNTFVGTETLENALGAANNSVFGYKAGDLITTGDNNIVIGASADPSSATVSNEITLGDANITKFRIPGINVTLKDNGGTPTQGHVLTVDGSGEAGFAAIGAFVTGMIIIWSGAANAIPSGWVLCNGSNSTPDLRGRFVVGYHDGNGDYDVNDTGGAESVTLSTSQIPSHDHAFSGSGSSSHNHSFTVNNEYDQLFHPKQSMIARGENKSGTESYGTSSATVSLSISGTTNSAGSGGSHENRPPYYALCYIMKT